MRHTIPPTQEILYRLPEVIVISGKRRATIYADMDRGEFPRPVQLGPQSVAWRKSDLDQWIRSRPVVEPRHRPDAEEPHV